MATTSPVSTTYSTGRNMMGGKGGWENLRQKDDSKGAVSNDPLSAVADGLGHLGAARGRDGPAQASFLKKG